MVTSLVHLPPLQSSLLTLLATFSGLVTALMMPIIGAIVDHTSLRWAIGAGGALMLIVFQIIYLSLGGDTLWLCAIISIFGNFCFYTHYLALLSYLPELFDDEKDTTFINFYTNVLNFSSQIISIVGVIILTAFLGYVKDCEGQGEGEGEEVALVVNTTKNCTEGVLEAEMYDNALGSHRVAQMWSIVFGGTMFAIVWGNYMQHRPPLHPESTGAGGSLVKKGYRKLAKTYQLFQGEWGGGGRGDTQQQLQAQSTCQPRNNRNCRQISRVQDIFGYCRTKRSCRHCVCQYCRDLRKGRARLESR